MLQTYFAITFAVFLKLLSANQLEVAVDILLESIRFAYIVQNREEYDEQFLVKVYRPFLVHRIQIHRISVLHYRRCRAYSACPVYLVVSCMEIFQHKEEEALVVFVELQQRKQYVKKGVAQSATAKPSLCDFLLIDDGGIIRLVILVYHNRTVDPHCESI